MAKKSRPRSVAKLAAKRPPGLDGTYTGTCISCLRPTDTALGVRGIPDWHIAFLVTLGLPTGEATVTVEHSRELAPDGHARYDAAYRVCQRCADKSPFPKPVLAITDVLLPTIVQP